MTVVTEGHSAWLVCAASQHLIGQLKPLITQLNKLETDFFFFFETQNQLTDPCGSPGLQNSCMKGALQNALQSDDVKTLRCFPLAVCGPFLGRM